MLKLIIHAPTAASYARACRNLSNFLATDPTAVVELVVNSEAVKVATEKPDDSIRDHLVVCQNSLNSAGLTCPPNIRIVQAAVLHIAQRQTDGWSYFRA
jgi:intracellular sulfur oxidation DsrE/DsrF family protein